MDKDDVLAWLKQQGNRRTLDEMGSRYGIVAKHAFGVPMGTLQTMQKRLGTDHALATALWESGCYEARLLAALIGDPARVTSRQMDAWAASLENWGDCDTVCFKLWDRTPLAWAKAGQWAKSPREFVKRGGFVLMACLALHDKTAPDKRFLPYLPVIEQGARDERNFVKKGVSWALRGIGGRSPALKAAATAVAERLAQSKEAAPRWVGKDALRAFAKAKAKAKAKKQPQARSPGTR